MIVIALQEQVRQDVGEVRDYQQPYSVFRQPLNEPFASRPEGAAGGGVIQPFMPSTCSSTTTTIIIIIIIILISVILSIL